LRAPRRFAGFSPAVATWNASLKAFLNRCLYDNPQIVEERERSVEALDQLFHYYLDHPQAMPEYYSALAERGVPHRVVCDYIAGMTDHFLLRQHRALVDVSAGR